MFQNPASLPTDCGDGGDDLSELQLVEDCGLSRSVQPDHQDPHLLLSEQSWRGWRYRSLRSRKRAILRYEAKK